MFPLGAGPFDGGVQRNPVDPGGVGRIAPEVRHGTPELDGDLLEEIVVIMRGERVSANRLEDQRLVPLYPLLEDFRLSFFGHFPGFALLVPKSIANITKGMPCLIFYGLIQGFGTNKMCQSYYFISSRAKN